MAIAIILTGQQDVQMVHWAARIAASRDQGLVLVWAMNRRGSTKRTSSRQIPELPSELQAICEELDLGEFRLICDAKIEDGGTNQETSEADQAPQRPLEVVCLSSERLPVDVEAEIEQLDISCLILIRHNDQSYVQALHEHLLSAIDCEIVVLIQGENESGQCRTILTPVGDGPHSASCLRMANDIAQHSVSKVDALHVEPDVDDVSSQVAERFLDRNVTRAIGSKQELIRKRVAISSDVVDGIKQTVKEDTDLIILGMKRHAVVRRFRAQGIAERLAVANLGPTIAVVQSAMPLSTQVGRWWNERLRDSVPQLPRDQRVSLVERIQNSSRWDFDFIMLICMSTLIAAGGLIQDSAAVVIGAMLVAPLMTPLLGTGLSLVQGNSVLFRSTLMTVLKGFLLAFLISWLVGWLVPGIELTPEMKKRCLPTVLDIVVAMVGGIAAAYASGRPNLLSALPGVAIAASLVPPIATSGLAASQLLDLNAAVGSALLFLTNIVAIILGTAVAFLAVGIRSTHQHGDFNRWSVSAGGALFAITIGLGIYESWPARPGGELEIRDKVNALATAETWSCTKVEWEEEEGANQKVPHVYIDAGQNLSAERIASIRESIRETLSSTLNESAKVSITKTIDP